MTTRISPNFRQQILCPQQVSVNTFVTGQDAYKVWTHTVVGTITFTLPAALKGAGPMYFCEQLATNIIVVQPRPNDHIVGLANGAPLTMSTTGAFVGLFCELDGTWSFVSASLTAGALPGGFSGFAAPTNKISLAPNAAGSATTALQSDCTIQLDVTISPTWTGNHIFTPGSGVAVILNGVANQNTLLIQASTTSGQSFGADIRGGTTSADRALIVRNKATTAIFMLLNGDGSGSLGPSQTTGFTWTAAGNVTLQTPTSGTTTLSVNAIAATTAIFATDGTINAFVAGFAGGVLSMGTGTAHTLALVTSGTAKLTISSAGNVVINAPTSGAALAATGAAGQYVVREQGSATVGSSFGEQILAGTNASDVAFDVRNTGATAIFIFIRGDGSGTLGPSSTLGLQWTAGGNVSISSPTSGNALVVTQNTASAGVVINGSNGEGLRLNGTAANGSFLQTFNGATFVGFFGAALQQFTGTTATDLGIGAASGKNLYLGNGTTFMITLGSGGNVTIAVPTSGTTVSATGVANGVVYQALPSATGNGVGFYMGTSLGVGLVMTSSGSDFSKIQNDAANTWSIATNNALATLGTPVFQWKNNAVPKLSGRGPNAAALVDMTPDTGTFTATQTGGTTAPTVTAVWSRQGNQVMITFPTFANMTSNSNACTITGFPAALTPARTQGVSIPAGVPVNAGAIVSTVSGQVAGTVLTLLLSGLATGWSNTATLKGLQNIVTIQYMIN